MAPDANATRSHLQQLAMANASPAAAAIDPAGSPRSASHHAQPPRALRINTSAPSPPAAAPHHPPPSPLSTPPSLSSPTSSRSASPSPRTPSHPHHRPSVHAERDYPPAAVVTDAPRTRRQQQNDQHSPDANVSAPSAAPPSGNGAGQKPFFGRTVSQSGSRSGGSRGRKQRSRELRGSSPRMLALAPGALADMTGEPTLLPPEEPVAGDEEGEYSFSETPISSTASTSSTSSSLPSTSTCLGRAMRAAILTLRSCVNSKTKRILTISSLVSLCFVIGTIIYVATAVNELQGDYDWVVHTDQVKVNIENIYISLLNAEDSARGYLITGSPSFLGPYNNSLQPSGNDYLWPYVWALSNLTTDNPVQIANVAELLPLIDERLDVLNMTISDFNTLGFAAAQYDVATYSLGVMTTIRAILNNMTDEETMLLTQREQTFSNSIHTVTIVMFVVLACVALTIIAGLLIGYDWDTKHLRRTNGKLEILLQKAEEGTKMKSLFLANMSHEIRTPMNGVLAMSELLASTPMSPDQHDIVDTILTSAHAMMRLINDLLLFSKIEAGKFTLVSEWFFLPTFLTPITDMFTVRAHGKGIEYSTLVDRNVPRYVYQDSGRLRQILTNLCDNAVKFTSHGRVRLHVAFVKRLVPVKGDGTTPTAGNGSGGSSAVGTGAMGKESRSSKEISANKLSLTSNGTPTQRSGTPQQAAHLSPPSPRPKLPNGVAPAVNSRSGDGSPMALSATEHVALDVSDPAVHRGGSLRGGAQLGGAGSTVLEERHYIIFSVTDSGIGIAPAVQKSIFEPFQQADNSTTREYGGTGLGLSISAQLVKSMGGRLKVRSALGQGATFEFAVPVSAEQLAKALEMEAKDAEDGKDEDGGQPDADHRDDAAAAHSADPAGRASAFNERMVGVGGDALPLGKSVRSGLEMMTIEEGDREHRLHHHHHHQRIHRANSQHDGDSLSESSAGISTSGSMSASAARSVSGAIKWHIDWFPDECYDPKDRAEQKAMMEQAGQAPLLPQHFAVTPPSLGRAIQSAPPPDLPLVLVPVVPMPVDLPRSAPLSSFTSSPLGSPTDIASSTRGSLPPSGSVERRSDSDDRRSGSASTAANDSPEPPRTSTAVSTNDSATQSPDAPVRSLGTRLGHPLPLVAVAASPNIPSTTRSASESVTSTPLTGTSTISTTADSGPLTNARRRLSKAAVITPQGPRLRILVVEDNVSRSTRCVRTSVHEPCERGPHRAAVRGCCVCV